MRALQKTLRSFFQYSLVLALFLVSVSFAHASQTNGTIDPSFKYAKVCHDVTCTNPTPGIINFAPTVAAGTEIHIQDSGISGEAWGNELGFIAMNTASGGLSLNPTTGAITGYAWSQASGWINFSPTGQGVSIDAQGQFTGYAWAAGPSGGWVKFDCSDSSTCVKTDWRPVAARTCVTNCGNGSGGPVAPPPPPVVPPVVPPTVVPPVTPPQPVTPPAPPLSPAQNPGQSSSGGSSSGGASGSSGGGGSLAPVVTPQGTPFAIPSFVSVVIPNFVSSFVADKCGQGTLVTCAAKAVKAGYESTGATAKVVSTVGVVSGSVPLFATLFATPLSFSEIFLFPLRLWALILTALGLKKRFRPWGTAYDSVTKQPLDPAYVVLQTLDGKEVSDSITDLDGRYGFLVTPGRYKIVANKSNYTFPSVKLAGKTQDELYSELYFGDEFLVNPGENVVRKNIPLDPVNFDWNEFAKKNLRLTRFFSKHDVLVRKLSNILFGFGFFVSVIALFVAPAPYNIIVFVLYLFLSALRLFGFKPKTFGVIRDKATGAPLSFAIVRIFRPFDGQEIVQRVTDAYGRYYCLVPKGQYFLKIEKKNLDESYTPVFTSPILNAKDGLLNNTFEL